jgi:uncharacterized protein YbjT (DUF2867 family)
VTRRALVAGATGLVGRQVVHALLDDPEYATVTLLVRRPTGMAHPKLVEQVIDFDRLQVTALPPVDDVYSCLGTTIRRAGSQEAFRRVDLDYPLAIARAALARGARRFLFVSAMGADARSRIFYNRVKGQLEEALAALPFQAVIALRPSLLAGERTEHRLGERLALKLALPLRSLLPARYRPVPDVAVARAMLACAKRALTGFHVVESDAIQNWAPA